MKIFGKIFLFFALLVIASSVLLLLHLMAPKPPSDLVADARKAISEATASKANVYLSKQYTQANNLYDSILTEWKKQNDRFFLKRDFSKIEELSERTIELAGKVSKESGKLVGNMQIYMRSKIDTIDKHISLYDPVIKMIPLPGTTIENYTKAKMIYSEGKSAYNQKEFSVSNNKIDRAELNLNAAFAQVRELLENYFEDYQQWIEWRDETIKWSRKNNATAIIIDKCSKSCMIYQSGKLKNTYPVELGKNWIGHKKMKGDKATPEGQYKVSKKISGSGTIYYKALLINYPNDEDKREFEKEIRKGILPKNTDIGGLIEIHGEGGRGFNWTNGCVALRNEDIEKIFSVAQVGTPVTIIGSEKELKDIFKLD